VAEKQPRRSRSAASQLEADLRISLRSVIGHAKRHDNLTSDSACALGRFDVDDFEVVLLVMPRKILKRLTIRQREILSALGEELGNRGMANRLKLRVPTVKAHLRDIYRKLGLRSRAAVAKRFGWVLAPRIASLLRST
jgi:DNA-binding NarL/FixJ family response regulator